MSIADAVVSKRERLFEAMMETADTSLGTPEPAVRQFVWGFINVLESSARDDHSARDIYLSSVIPALRGGALPFAVVIASMLRVTAAAACVLGPEHMQWVSNYCADYTTRLVTLWQAPT